MSVGETLDQLRVLQGLDDGIRALESELEELPRRLQAAREDHASVEQKCEAARVALQELQKKRRTLEQQIADIEQSVVKFENDKLKVKTNEEFRALNHQIERVKEEKSRLEDQVLFTYDEEEAATRNARRLEEEMKQVGEQLAADEKETESRSAEDRTRLEELLGRRKALVESMDARLLSRYETVRSRKGGTAVVPVVRGSCGGCHTQQPPQKVNEIRKQNKLHTCDFCGRFLLWTVRETAAP